MLILQRIFNKASHMQANSLKAWDKVVSQVIGVVAYLQMLAL